MATHWLTYAEAAARLKIGEESVRRQALRKHWPKKLGNDGKALVAVPLEALEAAEDRAAPSERDAVLLHLLEAQRHAESVILAQERKIAALEAAIATLLAEAKFLSRRGLAARLRRIADYRGDPPPSSA